MLKNAWQSLQLLKMIYFICITQNPSIIDLVTRKTVFYNTLSKKIRFCVEINYISKC